MALLWHFQNRKIKVILILLMSATQMQTVNTTICINCE